MFANGTWEKLPSNLDLFLGNQPGVLGETCALALILGGVYLVVRRVINPIIPLSFIGTVFALTAVAGANPLQQILSGGVMLGAIFMATDYSTSPMTNGGKLIFGIGCGLITVLIRLFGSSAEEMCIRDSPGGKNAGQAARKKGAKPHSPPVSRFIYNWIL